MLIPGLAVNQVDDVPIILELAIWVGDGKGVL